MADLVEAGLPGTDALDACLALLADTADEPGTLELHDPIYLMRRDADPVQLPMIRAALERFERHSTASQIHDLLRAWIPREERSLQSVLVGEAPIPDGVEPLDELTRRLKQSSRVRSLLQERVTVLENRLDRWMRTANLLAAAGALSAVIGVIGWLVALGALSLPWVDSPVVDMDAPGTGQAHAPESSGSPGEAHP